MLVEMRTIKITEKGQIAIPKEIRKIKGFKTGSKIAILAFKDHIELRPLKQFNKKIYPVLMSEKALSKDWLSKKDEKAWKDL
tara:strand:- start:205 stop:450 length:246 start_codon:yes stop_codon:yes gene_type:complete